MKILLWALIAILAGSLLVYTFIGMERVWVLTSGDPDMGAVDFKTLKKTPKPNQYLMCPKDYCAETPDTISTTYDIPAAKLFAEIRSLVAEDKDLQLLATNEDERSIRFLSRSKIMRFPDTTNIKIIEISDTQSTLAIYAQAKMGVSDMGANKKRVDAMIKRLEKQIAASN